VHTPALQPTIPSPFFGLVGNSTAWARDREKELAPKDKQEMSVQGRLPKQEMHEGTPIPLLNHGAFLK
jgi:hypothetical protein